METELEFLQRLVNSHKDSLYIDGDFLMKEVEERIEKLTSEEEQ